MLLFADGFDHYGPVPNNGLILKQGVYSQTALNTSGGVFSDNPRTDAYALRLYWTSSQSLVRRSLPFGEEDLVGAAFAFSLNSLPGDNTSVGLFQFRNVENATLASVWLWSTGQVAIFAGQGGYQGDGETELISVSPSPVIYPGSYQHFEAAYNPETGCEVRINGVTVANSGPFAGATGKTAQIVIGGGKAVGFGGLGITMDVDDLVVWSGEGTVNNDFMGDVRVYTRFPNADGAEQEWAPSIGSDGFEMIDNVPAQDATEYLLAEELVSGAGPTRSTFGLSDFPEEIVATRGVYIATRAFKTDSGMAVLKSGVIAGGSEDLGVEHSVSQAPVWYGDVYEVNPATGIVWAPGELNGIQTIIERTE